MKTLKRNFLGIILLTGMVLIFSQCAVIKPGFNGVLNRPLGDGIKVDKVYEDGFTWKAPWNNMMKYNVQLNSYQENISILSSDELHTTITLSAILRPIPENLPYLALEIGDEYYNRIVKPEFYSVSRSIMAEYQYNTLSIKSPEIENRIFEELKIRLDGKHIELNKVTLDHIMYSTVVTRATDQKLATQQQVEQKSYEIEIAEKEAEIQRINARGQRDAQQIIDQGLTQQYLQFKALEVQNKLSESSNSTFYFVPLGNDGLPIIIDTSSK
jgi:regulator of protease activity HflC (stomatin/prohibitin superfamily)